MFAGEHAAGVSAFDVILGLIVGNMFAVLSWMFLTAPIATRARLTLYFQLEKICGRKLVLLYNLANGIMFCFLAGAMITVSATALGVWFDFNMPALSDVLPNSVGWVIAALVVGSSISVVAAFGYNMVVIFTDYWLMKKIKMKSYFAEHNSLTFNWAAALTWFITLGVCSYLVFTGKIQIFFVSLPGWFAAALLYLGFSKIYQKRYSVSVVQSDTGVGK